MLMVTVSANAWKFTLNNPADSEVESLTGISLGFPGGGWLFEYAAVECKITDGNGNEISVFLANSNPDEVTPDYRFQEISEPGTYTLTIPAGSFHLNDNWSEGEACEAQSFTWTIKGSDDQGGGTQGGGTQGGGTQGGGTTVEPWTFASVTPAEGTVESLGTFKFAYPALFSNWQTPGAGIANGGIEGTLTLPDGTTQDIKTMEDFDQENGELHLETMTAPGTYTITFAAGAGQSNGGVANAEMTYTWTIKAAGPDYTVSYDKANGIVKLTWPEGTVLAAADQLSQMMHPTIPGYEMYIVGGNWNTPNVIEVSATLAEGDWTINFPAGDFTINGTPNEAISETFTVGGGTQGGGGTFEGEPFHETIFEAGVTAVSIPYTVDNTNVSISTVGRPFLDTTIDVGYNMNSEKELNWKNGTKFVITAKTDINKVIFVPTADSKSAIAYASATGGNGEYNNGVWEGKLAAGETLTLTANDGINIKEFYICYNGDDFDPIAGGSEEKGVITIQYPTENQLIAKQVDGGKFCVFTTNKEYAYVTIQVVNSNPVYDNLDGFPVRMVDNMGENSDNLHVGENTIYAATPASGSAGHGDDWYWFKGDSYTMIVKGFVNPWDNEYDAIAEVHFVGNGKEHVAESTTKLINVTPASGSQIAMVNGVVTLEFDGPVSSVTALTPGGQFDPTINYTATAKAGSDNKVWEINLGDRSGYASADTDGNPILEVDVTATAADGIVLLSDTRADRGLELKYELVAGAGPAPVITLGTPTWSVAEGAEIEASTSSINFKFPQVGDLYATYTFEVSGTIADKQMNFSIVNGTGTVASGADINVTLAEDVAYNLQIGTITIKDGETVVYSTESGNYQLNFATKAAQGGNDGEIEVTGDKNGATFTFVNESDVALSWNEPVTVNGTASDRFDLGMEWNEIVFSPAEPLADGQYDVVFTASSLIFDSQNENATDIKVTFYVVDGNITMTAPQPEQPTSVIIYEEGVDTHTHNTELNFSKYDVTLTSETTGNSYVVNNFKPGISGTHLRLFSYNTLKFAAERDIVQIEFVPVVASTKWGAKSVSTGSFADNVWTGKSKTVDLVLNGTNMDVLKIIVTLAGAGEQAEAQMVITDAKWGTFIAPFDAELPEGVEAYTVTGVGENGVLTLVQQESIKAHTPVVVYSENPVSETLKGTVTEKKTGIQNVGLLYGVYDETDAPAETGYVLQNQPSKGVAFYKVPSTAAIQKVAPNRCYLVYGSGNARAAYFFTEEDATAINGINADVLGAEGIYNASGVRVNSLQKGLNIIKTANGTKKVMIK